MTKEQIKRDYEDGSLDYIHAIEALQEHHGMSGHDAEDTVSEWEAPSE